MGLETIIDVKSGNVEQAEEAIEEFNNLVEEYSDVIPVTNLANLSWTGMFKAQVNNTGGINIPKSVRDVYKIHQGNEVIVRFTEVEEDRLFSEGKIDIPDNQFVGTVTSSGSVTVPNTAREREGIIDGETELHAMVRNKSITDDIVIYEGDDIEVVESLEYEVKADSEVKIDSDLLVIDKDDPNTKGYTVRTKGGEVLKEYEDEDTAVAFAEGMEN